MKLSTFVFGAFLLSPIACASDSDLETEESAESTQDELTTLSRSFAGSYDFHNNYVQIESMLLNSDGTFSAETDYRIVYPNSKIACSAGNCTKPEEGTFRAFRSAGKQYLVLNPRGANNARRYEVTRAGNVLTMTRAGVTFKMEKYVPTCAATTCAPGNICIDTPSGAECRLSGCARVRCASGTRCFDEASGPACLPDVPSGCRTIRCAGGYVCGRSSENPRNAACNPSCAVLDCMAGTVCAEGAFGAECR
jgi:hypothetical protein